ncbi:BTAD domain-containing putative transcriptional regulator [Amycolatopsis sp. cmx-8-4]|uniref:AfsR/SARP family transcriptional regulator n=1 Tax=Amycolatopsis sp. cmx-8-4 TaxID=2790947 RepID=UPI00397D1A29
MTEPATPPRLRLLGPAELGSPATPVGSPRESVVLAVLALDANREVGADRLVDALWGEQPPATARSQVQICVSALRRRLRDAGGFATITTRAPGYRLDVAAGDLDLTRFAELAVRARTDDDACEAALALWRGPAFAGLDSDALTRAATRLAERRLDLVEQRVRARLERGDDVLPELTALVDEHPLREHLHLLLMRALHRDGRRADALTAFRRARDVLVDELGVEPGPELRDLQAAILAGERPAVRDVVAPPVPRQLPAPATNFTGRDAALRAISARLCGPADPQTPFAVRVVGISGAGGVGKSALAVRAAHELAAQFPDGQLYADLHDDSAEDSTTWSARVLGSFLRALGMAEELLPRDPRERAELYRTRLADRRVLVVLDGVRREADVLPLLPGSAGCAVLTTSRARLTGLPGAAGVQLDVLEEDVALRLLATFVGDERLSAEPEAAEALVAACDRLPLALSIAGAKLASRDHWALGDLLDRLTDEKRRLDELSFRGVQLRSTIALSYHGLSDPARSLFRRMATPRHPDLPHWAPGALLDLPHVAAEDALAELLEANLIADGAPPSALSRRWRFHDLVRVFATERAAAEDSVAEHAAALRRLGSGWLGLAEQAQRPEFGDRLDLRGTAPRREPPASATAAVRRAPLQWVDEERFALVTAVREAAAAEWDDLCWELAVTAAALFEIRGYFDDWREIAQLAITSADRAGDAVGAAAARYSLGALLVHQGRPDDAARLLEPALAGFRAAGIGHGVGATLRQLATVRRLNGDLAAARACATEALPLLHAAGDRSGEAHARSELARLDLDARALGDAAGQVAEALRLARDAGASRTEAQILYRSADVDLAAGRVGAAGVAVDRVLEIASGLGDRIGVGYALFGQGRVAVAAGDAVTATARFTEAVTVAGVTGDRHLQARAHRRLGELAGDAVTAAEHARQAELLLADVAQHASGGR